MIDWTDELVLMYNGTVHVIIAYFLAFGNITWCERVRLNCQITMLYHGHYRL